MSGDPISDFRAAMKAAGLATSEEIVADGKLHRFYVEGDTRGKENGWYILHVDERPAGRFGSHKWGDPRTEYKSWSAKVDRRLTDKERRELERRMAEQRRIREEETLREQDGSARVAKKRLAESKPADPNHPYLVRKKIKPHSVLQDIDGRLVIPMKDGNRKLWNLQIIDGEGIKKFLWKARIEGCYFTLFHKAPAADDTILICEGFATGASLFEATGFPTVVSFNTANLPKVGRVIREKFPEACIIICGDNDQWTTKKIDGQDVPWNPGVECATKVAEDIGAWVAIPNFAHDDPKRPTDWNDAVEWFGPARVKDMIEAACRVGPNSEQTIAVLPQEAQVEGHGAVAAPLPRALPSGRGFRFQIADWPIMNAKGKPLACIENVDRLLEYNGIRVRYDVIRKDLDILIPGESYLVDTRKNDQLVRIVSIATAAGISQGRIEDYVSHIAAQNPYNPVTEWITSKPWDGESRLEDFFETVVAKGEISNPSARQFKETLLKRWMISAVAAAFRPDGVSAHGILVFRGDQYLGKTNWFKHLVPQDLRLTRDGMLLDPKDKDSVYQIVSNWIVELGELDATFRRADVAQLKSFITKDQDSIRLPYRREPATFARRTVFFGSVNDEEYLSDPTGNRRFWTIDCEFLHHDHALNMQQVWAEFYDLYQKGESWYLTQDEMAALNAHNKGFEVVAPIEELVRARYPWGEPKAIMRPKTAAEIAQELGFKSPTVRETRAIGKAIREITGQDQSKSNGRRVYNVPYLPDTQQGSFYPYND